MNTEHYIDKLISRFPVLDACKTEISEAFLILKSGFECGGKLLVCGNGGSASDAEHIVGELMKGFKRQRKIPPELQSELTSIHPRGKYIASKLQRALPAIALTGHTSLNTAVANDTDAQLVFAQQVMGYGKSGDTLLGISTSGSAANVCDAFIVAKALNLKTIGLTGKDGGRFKQLCDVSIIAPEQSTEYVQELHLPIYHTLCSMLEDAFFS